MFLFLFFALPTFPILSTTSKVDTNSVRHYLRRFFKLPTPIVLWHGMGDSCCSPWSMVRFKSLLEKNIRNVHVHSIRIGDGSIADIEHSYFGNVNKQIDDVCKELRAEEELRNGYHAVGFSQGAQFLRALAQRCPDPPMRNLVSLGGQHQGVFGLPRCPESSGVCDKVRRLLEIGAYVEFVQNSLIQAQYWHDPYMESVYREKSIFLADINNENVINETYKENLLKLDNLVLVKFLNDTMVVPKESEWFEFYAENDTSKIIPLEKSRIYVEDRIGLRTLQESERLHLIAFEGDHLQISDSLFISQILNKFLR